MKHKYMKDTAKRISFCLLVAILALSLVACAGEDAASTVQGDTSSETGTSLDADTSESLARDAASVAAGEAGSVTIQNTSGSGSDSGSGSSQSGSSNEYSSTAASSDASTSLTTNGGAVIALSALEHRTEDEGAPEVYYISDISAASMVTVYDALGWTPTGDVAVKISSGEPPSSNYLRPELISDLVHHVDGTLVECNTAYGGERSSTAEHYQVAEDHGFTAIADFRILDEDGSMTLPVDGGTVLSENLVGAAFADYEDYLILSHFKGHAMAGFGGAIKNISIGLASSEGKSLIHSGGSGGSMWGGDQDSFLEAMGDAGKSVSDYLGHGERIVYINVMNRLSVDCDCDGNPAEPDMHDVGILASRDPVALDQACVDLVYASDSEESASLRERIESRNGLHTLENAEAIGLGSRSYRFIDISPQV